MYTSAEGKEPCITTSRFLSFSLFFLVACCENFRKVGPTPPRRKFLDPRLALVETSKSFFFYFLQTCIAIHDFLEFYVTCNDISVIFVTAQMAKTFRRVLKRARPTPTWGHPFYTVSGDSDTPPPHLVALYDTLGIRNVSSVSPACRKRRLIGAVCRNHRIKRLVPCRTIRKVYGVGSPTVGPTFFSVRLHICTWLKYR